MKMLGRDFVNLVCDALGLTSQRIRAVTIRADCTSAVTVEVEEFVDVDQARKFTDAMKGQNVTVKVVPVNPEPMMIVAECHKPLRREERATMRQEIHSAFEGKPHPPIFIVPPEMSLGVKYTPFNLPDATAKLTDDIGFKVDPANQTVTIGPKEGIDVPLAPITLDVKKLVLGRADPECYAAKVFREEIDVEIVDDMPQPEIVEKR